MKALSKLLRAGPTQRPKMPTDRAITRDKRTLRSSCRRGIQRFGDIVAIYTRSRHAKSLSQVQRKSKCSNDRAALREIIWCQAGPFL